MIKIIQNKDYAEISLNRPNKRNSLNTELMNKLIEELSFLRSSLKSLKFLLIKGEGKSFCAGADLSWMKEMANFSFDENQKDSSLLFEMFHTIYDFPLPVITIAHGHVYGGGLGILAASDYVLSDENTKFSFSEVKLGLAPAVISSFVLSKCNISQARALMTSGEVFSNASALNLGISNKILSETNLQEVTSSYQQASQEALISTKHIIKTQTPINPLDFKSFTIEQISKLRISNEAQTRMKNFLLKIKES